MFYFGYEQTVQRKLFHPFRKAQNARKVIETSNKNNFVFKDWLIWLFHHAPPWYSVLFRTGEIIFFVLSVRSQNKTFVDFIHKFISLKTEEQLFKPIQWLCLKSCVPRPFLNQVIATWKWRNVQCNFQIFWAYIYKYSYSQRPNPGLIPAPCFNDTPDNLLSQPR